MVTNFFFQNYTNSNEQVLLEDLIIESIKIYGSDCYFLPRNLTNFDSLLTEDSQSTFTQAYMVEVYLKNYMGFKGDRNLMSKFAGLEIRDQVIFNMARRTFSNEIGITTGLTRPREGDILFFTMNKKPYVIRHVEAYEFLYQLGNLYTWELTCELFEYSSEVFKTGIPEIDVLQEKFSINALDYALRTETGNWLTTETGAVLTNEKYKITTIDPLSHNEDIDQRTLDLDLIDFSEPDPFSLGKIGNR